MSTVLLISPSPPGRFDGVGDYSYELARCLRPHLNTVLINCTGAAGGGCTSDVNLSPASVCGVQGWRELWRERNSLPFSDASAVLLQYVPQLYFPRADLPWLLLWLGYSRLAGRNKIIITVHEYNVPWGFTVKRGIAHVILNFLIVLLGMLSTRIVVTHELNRRKLSRLLFFNRGKISLIPVSTNIPSEAGPDPREDADDAGGRESSSPGARPAGDVRDAAGPPVLTLFGQPSAMEEGLLSFLGRRIASGEVGLRVWWLGRSREEIVKFWCQDCGLPAGALEVYEKLPAAEVGRVLGESDVFLAPLVDGVSTRRTTIVAALSQGLPVIGTRGACTDDSLARSPAFLLCETWDEGAFLRHIQLLCTDRTRRREMGREARALFLDRFSWEKIGREYLRLLQS